MDKDRRWIDDGWMAVLTTDGWKSGWIIANG